MKCWCLVAWSGIMLTNSWDISMQTRYICCTAVGKYSSRYTINTVPYMHFCVSSTSAWWFIWRLCYIRNVVLFPTHLMCSRHLISERFSTYSWFQPGSVKLILLCKYCIHLKGIVTFVHLWSLWSSHAVATVETPGCIRWLRWGAFTWCLPGVIWIIFHQCSPGRKILHTYFFQDIPVRQRSRQMPARCIPSDARDNMDDPWMCESPLRIEHNYAWGQLMCHQF